MSDLGEIILTISATAVIGYMVVLGSGFLMSFSLIEKERPPNK